MKLSKLIFTLFIGAGLMGCSKANESTNDHKEGVPTYVNLSISLPGASTRALPDDYNPDGDYIGNDTVETLDIYMQGGDGSTEDAWRFTIDDISYDRGTGLISPNEPIRTTSGYKTFYIVINNPAPLGTSITQEDELILIDGLAGRKTIGGNEYDLITMTGKSEQIFIEADVTPQDVVQLGANHIAVEVVRIASKVIVTTQAAEQLTYTDGTVVGTLSDLSYSVAQGTKKVYWIEQPNYKTYGNDYVPVLGEYTGANNAKMYYDYSGLSAKEPIESKPTAGDGYKALPGTFLFENTHLYGSDAQSTEYRKGNTAYVLVRATLTPEPDMIADGGTLSNGTFYVGQSDGKIYSTKQAALAAVQNQKVATYTQGQMLYYAWLNPDDIAKPLNSPVLRNNIYHINITGFKKIGFNWNPLYPEDPNTTDPQNPDPKPGNPEEPNIPIDPIDPLTPDDTYMSIEVTALDWVVHSYDIEF